MSSDTQTPKLQNPSSAEEIELFSRRWFNILYGYQRDLEEIDQLSRFAQMKLAAAENLLTDLLALPTELDREITKLNSDERTKSDIRNELIGNIDNLIKEAQRIIGKVAEEMKLASVEDSKNRSGLNIRKKARNGVIIASFPILLPLLCICACMIIFLAIISSLTGGGPDQTQNMQSFSETCPQGGIVGSAFGCEAVRDNVRRRINP